MPQDRSGTTLGSYRLEKLLGEGGMGEVYVAEDTKLGRTVALKILRPEVVADPEHRSRFEREAKALAALKHPGIVTIYAFEEVDDVTFFVMDLVEGRTLTKIIEESERGLPVSRILELAIPIADAVAAAHKRGIAHRDLKPDNIIVGPRDAVTVLDFGLAKKGGVQFSGGQPDVTAPTMHVTLEGKIFGTVNYMAPEQAEAGETNFATDVFSIGVVIYEMATGDLPFKGDSAMSILSSILKDKPVPMATHDKAVPAELEGLVHRCLEKDPDRRWQSALDVRNELEIVKDQIENPPPAASEETVAVPTIERGGGSRVGWMVATCVFAVATAILGYLLLQRPAGVDSGIVDSTPAASEIWTFDCLTSDPGMENDPTLSPDGEFIAFSMRSSETAEESSIYLLGVGGNRPIELTADMSGVEHSPRFSPDGRRLVFRSGGVGVDGDIHVMRTTGDLRRPLGVDGFTPDWSPDGTQLVYSTVGYMQPHGRPTAGALRIIDLETGDDREIHPGDAVDPRWSPNGEWIIFWTVGSVDEDGVFQITGRRDIGIIRADGTDARLVTDDVEFDWSPAWADGGRRIVFSSNRGGPVGLWELDFDPETGEFGDEPRPIPAPSTYAGRLDASSDGDSIVFVDGMENVRFGRIPIDLDTLETSGLPEQIFDGGFGNLFDVSADGSRIVVSGGPMRSDDLYVSRGDGSQVRQLTDDAHRYLEPRLHPDGTRIMFFSNRSGDYEAWEVGIDGGGYRMLTDGWRLIDTPTVNGVDGTRATSTGEDWFVLPDDARSVDFKDVTAMPKIDDSGRWFFPEAFSSDGRRLLGAANTIGPFRQTAERRVAVYDLEAETYRIIERELCEPPFSLSWAPDERRIMVGNHNGIFVYDPDTDELRTVMDISLDKQVSVEFRITDNGFLYYSLPEDERDIWIARRGPATKLTAFGQDDS